MAKQTDLETKGEMPDSQVAETGLTRRQFLTGAVAMGALLSAGGVGLFTLGSPAKAGAPNDGGIPVWPWPYVKLNSDSVADRAYKAYFDGGCCYGAVKALIDELQTQIGYPYTMFPSDMFRFGGGGAAGWGTLCGAINGAAAVINLVTSKANTNKVVNELFGWYTKTAFPMYIPKGKNALATSVAGSPLCHASVTLWCKASQFSATSPERAERCARLTADVAAHTAILLNQQAEGKFSATYVQPESLTACMSCHGKAAMNNTNGTMNCVQCHEPHK